MADPQWMVRQVRGGSRNRTGTRSLRLRRDPYIMQNSRMYQVIPG